MPLSENELRVLSEIEKSFYEHDSAFADRMRSETVYKHSGRNLKWASLSFVFGFVFTVALFTTSVLLGLIGFLVMLGSALVFEQNLRRMGKASWHEIKNSQGPKGSPVAKFGSKLKGKFPKTDK
jgi:hypothetical protein